MAATVGILAAQDHPPANSDSTAPAAANTSGTAAANGTVNSGTATQLPVETDIRQLQQFLSLSPERLKKLRETIDNLDNMPLAERIAWSQEVNRRVQSIQSLGQEIRGDIRELPKPEDRSILSRYMMTLYPEDIQPLLKNLQDAKDKPDARKVIIQDMLKKAVANGIKPDPRATDRGPMPSSPRSSNRDRGANTDAGHSEPTPSAQVPLPTTTN